MSAQPDVLGTLRARHPRLLMLDSDLTEIRNIIQTDPFAKSSYDATLAHGEAILAIPVHSYVLAGSEHSLLDVSRDVEDRVFTLAGLYRLTNEQRFADRAAKEMLAAAAFPDWNPGHFLDTAEMTAALAVGYDWLYSYLSPEQRDTIRAAIVTKGLDPWIASNGFRVRFSHQQNNWVQVCNGGETLGALAVAEDEPAKARTVIDLSRPEMQKIMQLFAPDGGFEEGPAYWSYATIYNVLYLNALDTALSTDFGLSRAKGFAQTGAYRIQSIGPTWLSANFGDAGEKTFRAPQMYWMANRFHMPIYALQERRLSEALSKEMVERNKETQRFLFLSLLWYRPVRDGRELPTAQGFERIGQAYLRNSWTDPDAWYVAFKGGSAKASHGHLDLGSFILDALSTRWAIDLGAENYGLPGYWGVQRWTYYRIRTEAHNTITLDGENEDLDAMAPLSVVVDGKARKLAVLDLNSAYKSKLKSWHRGVELFAGGKMLVQDDIVPASQTSIVWHFHTRAIVELTAGAREAMLVSGNRKLRIRLLEPMAAHFAIQSNQVPPPQMPNPGVRDIVIELLEQTKATTIAVLFDDANRASAIPAIIPTTSWKAQ